MKPDVTRAQLRSACGLCDDLIYPGDLIVVVDDEWCHADCADGQPLDLI